MAAAQKARRTALTLDLACEPVTWSAHWAGSQGTRAYDGVSNSGAAIATTSAIAGTDLMLQGLHALDEQWSWGIRWSRRQLRRDIAGTGAVLGYPERFSYWQAGWYYQRERIGAGPARALTRNGIPVGAALQPRTVQTTWGLDFSLRYRF